MYARRFLGCITIVVVLAVISAFLMFQFGDRVLARMATPKGHYEAPTGDAPDYANASTWLARPGKSPTLADWMPVGQALPADASREAATFYIHPTTYLQSDRWNAPLDPGGEVEQRTRVFVESQASAFNGVSEVWAPRYRQAAFGAFLLRSKDAEQALDLAYGDVLKAFDVFLAAQPADRPIILAAHSQGSLHLLRLLKDRREALSKRLIAAYVVGWPVDQSADLLPIGLSACGTPTDKGCVMSWQSFADPANPDIVLREWEGSPGLDGNLHSRNRMVCANPISGSTEGGPPSANLGTLVPDGSLDKANLVPGLVGARCSDGLLILDGAPPAMGPYVLPGNNYHVYDYALFWGSIRADAARRLASWKTESGKAGQ